MTNLTIPAAIIRAAQQCTDKDEYRLMCRGILFAANGDVVATNGKVLFKCPNAFIVPEGFADTIVAIDKAIPASADNVIIGGESESKIKSTLRIDAGKAILEGRIINTAMPNYNNVIPKKDYIKADHTIGINAQHLAILGKVFPHCDLSMHHGAVTDGPVIFKPVYCQSYKPLHQAAYKSLKGSLLLVQPILL